MHVTFYCIFYGDKIFNTKADGNSSGGVLRHFDETSVLEFAHNLHLKSQRLQSLVVIVAQWRWSVEITQGQTRSITSKSRPKIVASNIKFGLRLPLKLKDRPNLSQNAFWFIITKPPFAARRAISGDHLPQHFEQWAKMDRVHKRNVTVLTIPV